MASPEIDKLDAAILQAEKHFDSHNCEECLIKFTAVTKALEQWLNKPAKPKGESSDWDIFD